MITRGQWRALGAIEREVKAFDLTSLDKLSLALDYIVASMAMLGARVSARIMHWPPSAELGSGEYAIVVRPGLAIHIGPVRCN